MYSINSTVIKKKFCFELALQRSKLLLLCQWYRNLQFKAKDSEIAAARLCLGNISKDWSVDNVKKLDLKGMFKILVLIVILLMLMTLLTFTIFDEKK